MLDLYARTWQGEQLGDDEYVISADEKTSIQARCRCHPTLAPGEARAMRVNPTYEAVPWPASPPTTSTPRRCSAAPENAPASSRSYLAAQVMSQEPYASAKRVFWIVDNGSSHRGRMAADRLTAVFPNTVNCGLK